MSADNKDGAPGPGAQPLTTKPIIGAPGPHSKKPVILSIDDQQIADIRAELVALGTAEIDEILPLAKWSLESVTHLTEYEDEKANRILTAIAFLSAMVGVAFAAIVQRYPLSTVTDSRGLGLH